MRTPLEAMTKAMSEGELPPPPFLLMVDNERGLQMTITKVVLLLLDSMGSSKSYCAFVAGEFDEGKDFTIVEEGDLAPR